GFDPDSAGAADLLGALKASGAGLVFLALGAPKQEAFAARGRSLAPQLGFASIGAGLDFLSGAQSRAPRWVQALAMEWAWRAAQAPARLVPRYLRCFAILPRLLRAAIALR
ncbi:MAG: WecB/TagA/CpsF family glycosyltransferase, partial [Roseobacter sp.]|nr:WecB/TagA/CpsF family glycosyltransferase [Roseobacter sp.]